jgi:hypothetical protein
MSAPAALSTLRNASPDASGLLSVTKQRDIDIY